MAVPGTASWPGQAADPLVPLARGTARSMADPLVPLARGTARSMTEAGA